MNKLPKVFVNKFKIKNNNSILIDNNKVDIDNILDKNTYPFNHKYNIYLKDNNVIKTSIVYKNNNYLLTIDGNKIYIKNIKSIKEIKK